MNRRESMTNTRHDNTNDPQKEYCLGTVSKNILLVGLKPVSRHQPKSPISHKNVYRSAGKI